MIPTLYNYLIKRKNDGKLFYLYGNFKSAGWGVGNLTEFVISEEADHMVEVGYAFYTDFGKYGILAYRNIPTDLKYNSRDYSVIYQTVAHKEFFAK